MNKRAEVYYTGRVQGVGFRYTAQSIASKYKVTGYVKNLPDRRVEVVAEGKESEINNFLDELYAQMQNYIEKFSTNWSDALNEFNAFNIKY